MRSITHKISIPSIVKIEKGSFDLIGDILIDDNIERVIIIIDQNMHNILSERIDKQFKKIKIEFSFLIVDTNLSLRKLSKTAYNLDNKTQLLLGIGGGSIIDRTKYISYLRKIPWISIPTSPSNDGISSPLSSLYIDNKRVSVPAKMPYGIIIDTNIIMNSPYHMIMSGIGDSVSNITAVYDMELESKHTRNQKDDFSVIFSLQSISSLMGLPIMNVRSEKFIESLLTSLVMSGIAMEMSGTSKPSSGSEHLISHAIDQVLEINNYPHGIQVGLSTYIVSRVQENCSKEINMFFTKTGFWEYVEELKIKKSVIVEAIKLAPFIKENRYTILSNQEYIDKAIRILDEDEYLKRVLF